MKWADVAGKFLTFLEKPSALGVVALALTFLFLLYVVPVAALTWVNYDGTNRIVGAINDLKTTMQPKLAFK